MIRTRALDLLAVGLVAAVSLVGVLLWGQLPDQLAIHWSGNTPDSFVAKPVALFGLPAFAAAVVAFVRYAPEGLTSTPGGEDASIIFLGVVFAWTQGIVLLWNLGLRFDVSLAVAPVLLLAAGLVALHYWRGPIAMR